MKNRGLFLLTLLLFLISQAQADDGLPARLPHHEEVVLEKNLLPGLTLLSQHLSLKEAIDLGLKNNPTLQASGSDVDIRRAMLRQAGAQRWPVVSVGANLFLHNRDDQTLMTPEMMMTSGKDTFFQDFNASAKVPLFTGGRILAGIRSARAGLEGTQAGYQQAQADMAFQIRQAYLTALVSQAEHAVHEKHLSLQNQLLHNVQLKYQVGTGLKADVLRVQSEIASAHQMLNEEHIRLNNALLDLKSAMGIDLASELHLSDTLVLRPWIGPTLGVLVQQATTNYPRIIQAQKEVKAAEAELWSARSQFLPQVNGVISGNLRSTSEPPMMGNGAVGWVSASMPLFDRSRGADIAKNQAVLNKARQNLKAVQLDIAKNIAAAWNEMQFSEQNAGLTEAAVAQAQEDFRLIQRRFDVGRSVIADVQDADYRFRQAELDRQTAIYKYELAKARLLNLLGLIRD